MVPGLFHPAVREWFEHRFAAPTPAQQQAWPVIARGDSTLLLAPTGHGKTLAAFLWCLNGLMFTPAAGPDRCRTIYVSPLKALAADIERNLQTPMEEIAAVARSRGVEVRLPDVAVRTGDTPARIRARFARHGADILITTPESLFLLLTSAARARLAAVETLIVDEIHALLPGKRGAHLALTLERLEALRGALPVAGASAGSRRTAAAGAAGRPLQRIGLSATQRPIAEAAQFLGGATPHVHPVAAARRARLPGGGDGPGRQRTAAREAARPDAVATGDAGPRFRPVTVVDTAGPRALALRVEVPIEHAARQAASRSRPAGAARGRSRRPRDGMGGTTSIWASIHPRLLELIRAHRSTLIFVNNRRLAERLADALNTLAGEPLVRSHHGSLAAATRDEVERLLKAGAIRALVTTSSLELGIDMGAIDLVVQVESPPSVASGLQRIGRSGHRAGAASAGVLVPKFRGDLLACAACTRAMRDAAVEATHYPRLPLDVLAQQIVATVSLETWHDEDLYVLVRGAAPFATLTRQMFDGVLDMLSGRYPSDAFAELRPRVTWDRVRGLVSAREGARQVVIANAGTIPDRGLYGVFLAGAAGAARVGELDEEMVFEMRAGETFALGASTWRVEDITHDRVLVSPAPGEPGRMPFWHGDQAGRSGELGAAIGALVRELRAVPRPAAEARLARHHDLESAAAGILLDYLAEQAAAGAVPDDRTIVVERCLDELGDWRLCVLTPFGSRVHAPWAMAAAARIRGQTGLDADIMWSDDGFVVRVAASEGPPPAALLLPESAAVEEVVMQQIGGSSLFAARFREAAARALLLPRRRPGARTPLWHQRKRAADLLAAIAPFGSFPIVLEAHREILRDYFDLPALTALLGRIEAGAIEVVILDTRTPSPFAASLLFSYVANYIYDGDAPLAERRAQALSVDQAQLRDLLGDAELRDLLDAGALADLERQLQHLDERMRVRSADGVHDLLLRIGDLSHDELHARSALDDTAAAVTALERAGRVVRLAIGGASRYAAVEDAARYRDAFGVRLPEGLPAALLERVADPAGDILLRYARTHGPFRADAVAARYGLRPAAVEEMLGRLAARGRVVEGEFRPHGTGREWVDTGVLRTLRRRSLARLRRDIEPVEPEAFARFLLEWHGIGGGRQGTEALLDAIEQLQGAPLPASALERDILPARIPGYDPSMLDTLVAAGEVVWVGLEPLGERDGRIALYLTDHLPRLRPPGDRQAEDALPRAGSRAAEVITWLRANGASFFAAIHAGTGGGYPAETVAALWELAWSGLVTNDTVHALRARQREPEPDVAGIRGPEARSRRLVPPSAQGRWSALEAAAATPTEWAAWTARQLLTRHGVVARETVASENLPGSFAALYPVFRAMEEAGRVRRGYFVSELGGAQFATAPALEHLRDARDEAEGPRQAIVLAAADPASPYGAALRWPARPWGDNGPADGVTSSRRRGAGPSRAAGAFVVLVAGAAAAWLRRGARELLLFDPRDDTQRAAVASACARALLAWAGTREEGRRGLLIEQVNGVPAAAHAAAGLFAAEGFATTAFGLQARTDKLRPRGYAPPEAGPTGSAAGIHLAAVEEGGAQMAKQDRDQMPETTPPRGEDREGEHERVRSSNERDQARERAGKPAAHNEGYDEAAGGDVDPDSANAQIDRDDTLDE